MHLFSDYLSFKRGAPRNGLRTSRGLHQLQSIASGVPYSTRGSLSTLPYWLAFIESDSLLKAYLASPQAFTSPVNWPEGFGFPDHLTPHNFAMDFTPKHRGKDAFKYGTARYRNWCFKVEGLHELMAYAMSWPVTPHEITIARKASFDIMEVPSVVAYALCDISILTPRFGNTSYIYRQSRWHKATTDPLALGTAGMLAALPLWCSTRAQLTATCPPRTEVLGSGSYKYMLDKDGPRE